MKEHEIYDKLDLAKKRLNLRPISCILNVTTFAYQLLLKQYDDLQELANNYSMTTTTPCVLCENFRIITSLEKQDFSSAELQIRYSLSIDPEDFYSYLFKGIIDMTKGLSGEEYFKKALVLAPEKEKELLVKTLNLEEDQNFKEIIKLPDYMPNEQIEKLRNLVSTEPNNPIYKAALSEAYLKKKDFRSSEWLLQSVISIYSYYPRALYILSRINEEYKNDIDASAFYLRKIFLINPLGKFCSKKEVCLDERDLSEFDEMQKVFNEESPIINYFVNKYSELKQKLEEIFSYKENRVTSESKPKEGLKEEVKKEEGTGKREQGEKQEFINENPEKSKLEQEAFEKLKEKKYSEALALFVKLLKKQ